MVVIDRFHCTLKFHNYGRFVFQCAHGSSCICGGLVQKFWFSIIQRKPNKSLLHSGHILQVEDFVKCVFCRPLVMDYKVYHCLNPKVLCSWFVKNLLVYRLLFDLFLYQFTWVSWSECISAKLPWIIPGAPIKSVGLPEISRVTWQVCEWHMELIAEVHG